MLNKLTFFKALQRDSWVKPFLKHYKKTLWLAIFLGVLTFICASGLMFISGYLITKSATPPENILLVYVPIVLTRAFGIFRPLLHYLERLTSHNWVFKMTSEFRKKMYDSLEQDAVFFNNKYRLGDILGLLSEDVAHIQNLYLRTLFPFFTVCGLYVFIILGLGIISPLFALWMLVLYGLLVVALPLWSVLVNGARQEYEKKVKNSLYLDLTDNVLGVADWIFSERTGDYIKRHEENEAKLLDAQAKMRKFERKRDLVGQLIFLAIILSVLVWATNRFGGSQSEASNWIAAFVLCVFPMADAFMPLSNAAQETNVYLDSIERLNKLPQPKESQKISQVITEPLTLKISGVTFAYSDGHRDILQGINLTLTPKEKLAILGRSGSGKSTLASLIRGDLVPTKGQITLNGIDVTEFGDEIAKYIGVIHQTPYLFNTTIVNNVRLGNEAASNQEVWDVLKRVGLEKLIKKLPQGLETMVDEAGLRFSGGERHRLALARILLKDAPIIILDEPTVGLDPITERALVKTFMEVLQDKTLIWITHHLQGVDQMDKIIFIEDGEIVLQGSPAKLSQNKRYQKLKQIDEGY
ncbi:thiol reductant ABC exporter subunit CydC [Ligilactobacillus apodemi]|uniref:thiol reductant ABC exporter subunit CydC n=1 Tax=Ligilactobacillus apodemi TaxID=307126 RepID=UPI00214AFC93|nr:thiol reductant ABC exporter subunit CydC [Ligilactobacillus apodemi]MCR1901003.1 thiol reductant ABC exporter subunit CydC [Ligilactobacillus apodemi]